MSASATSLIRKRSSTQDLGQARLGTAEKYRNRDGISRLRWTSMDGQQVLEREFLNAGSMRLLDGMLLAATEKYGCAVS